MGLNWNNRSVTTYNSKKIKGIWIPPTDLTGIPYRRYQVDQDEEGRLDLISFRVYGSEEYFWVIAQFNNILDPFNGFYVNSILKIPDLASYLERWNSTKK